MIISLCFHDDKRGAGDYKNQNYSENVAILTEIVIQLNLRQDLERKILLEMRGGGDTSQTYGDSGGDDDDDDVEDTDDAIC